jgi:hypothetical protein
LAITHTFAFGKIAASEVIFPEKLIKAAAQTVKPIWARHLFPYGRHFYPDSIPTFNLIHAIPLSKDFHIDPYQVLENQLSSEKTVPDSHAKIPSRKVL